MDRDPQLKQYMKTEVFIMSDIEHPNILHLYEYFESPNNYYLVLQFCKDGDLEHYVNNQPGHLLTENKAIYFLKQIMNGFQMLNKRQIMHRDFKLANIFLHGDTVIIGDFGTARAGQEMASTNLGTNLTKAPEVHAGLVSI